MQAENLIYQPCVSLLALQKTMSAHSNLPEITVKTDTWQSMSRTFSPVGPPPSALTPATASTTSLPPRKDEYSFFRTFKFKLCFFSMWYVAVWDRDTYLTLNVVLFALDQFIIVVAVPQIVSEFHSLDKGE